jgi:glycosyltransferase involved in cell wall biosynthesis
VSNFLFITYEYPRYTPFGGIAFYYSKVAKILEKEKLDITIVSAQIVGNDMVSVSSFSNGNLKEIFIPCRDSIEFQRFAFDWLIQNNTRYDFVEIPEYGAFFHDYLVTGKLKKIAEKIVVRVHGTTLLSAVYNRPNNLTNTTISIYNRFFLNKIGLHLLKYVKSKKYKIAKANFREFELIKNADLVTAPSNKMGDFINKYWLRKKETKVFPNPSQFSVGIYEKRNFNINILKVSYINRLQYWKGFDLFHILSKKFSVGGNIQFTAFGSYSQLNIGFTEDQISETIKLKGFTDSIQLIDVYRQSQIVIVPSRFESFSNVALEAMGFGCIVIVSDNIGMAEHISHGVNGFKFQSGKCHSLESVFSEIISMESIELERVSFNAYQTALKLSENNELLEFYRSV